MTRALASLCFALLLRCFALICFALLSFADDDDGDDELMIMILTIVRIVTMVSTLSIDRKEVSFFWHDTRQFARITIPAYVAPPAQQPRSARPYLRTGY